MESYRGRRYYRRRVCENRRGYLRRDHLHRAFAATSTVMHDALTKELSPAQAKECQKDHCRLDLDGLPWPVFVLDCDRYCLTRRLKGKMCDFLLFLCRSPLIVAAVEIK